MRILVDQSGYDLLNLGDVAMLQGCVARLRQQWPHAEIRVIAHSSERLSEYCPGALAIGQAFADRQLARILPRKVRLASEQLWRIAGPYCSGHGVRRGFRRDPQTAVQAVRWADVVVASGGGYLTDTWWWHAAGVLSTLRMAQQLGKPTAMFGQGIGPLQSRALREIARSVLPGLIILGLREGRIGPDLALSCGSPAESIKITGDDALEVMDGTGSNTGTAIGVNVRVARYADTSQEMIASLSEPLMAAADAHDAPIIGLPISRYSADADLQAISQLFGPEYREQITLEDLTSPRALVAASSRCRLVVTGSYHAAIFALGQGVPTVCLARSPYYESKFSGLYGLFPQACQVLALGQPNLAGRLRDAIDVAWELPAEARAAARNAATEQRTAGRQAYAYFREQTEMKMGNPLRPLRIGSGEYSGD